MFDAITDVPPPVNEPVRSFAPGSAERTALEARLKQMAGGAGRADHDDRRRAAPRRRRTHRRGAAAPQGAVLGTLSNATAGRRPGRGRGGTRRRPGAGGACPTTTGPRSSSRPPTCWPGRGGNTLAAATMLGQSKTCYQAEIDTAVRAGRLLALQRLLRPADPRRAADQLARRVEPLRPPPARGFRAGDHAVQLHRDRRQPAHRAGADGQHRAVEARHRRSSSPRTTRCGCWRRPACRPG